MQFKVKRNSTLEEKRGVDKRNTATCLYSQAVSSILQDLSQLHRHTSPKGTLFPGQHIPKPGHLGPVRHKPGTVCTLAGDLCSSAARGPGHLF